MKALIIEPTAKTPSINFDVEKQEFKISGKSIPQDAEFFYEPVLEWFEKYLENPSQRTELTIDLEYFNISSSKRLLFIMYKLNDLHEQGYDVKLNWYHSEGDDDMYEVGQDYAFMVRIPFEFIARKEREPDLHSQLA